MNLARHLLTLAAALAADVAPAQGTDRLTLADLPVIQHHMGAMQVFYSNALRRFNNRSEQGLRWAAFSPTADSFRLPEKPDFTAVDFADVQAVGLHLQSRHAQWGWTMGFNSFVAFGTSRSEASP